MSAPKAPNIEWHPAKLSRDDREALAEHRGAVLWFTGLSGSGKSTVANLVDHRLHAAGKRSYLLDGDNVRFGLNSDLGFSPEDRTENIRRLSQVARLFVDAGVIVLVAAISPYRRDRAAARTLVDPGQFVEIFVDTPLDVCETRDPKGLYKKARAGEISDLTGVDAPYEAPSKAEVVLAGDGATPPEALAESVMRYLAEVSIV